MFRFGSLTLGAAALVLGLTASDVQAQYVMSSPTTAYHAPAAPVALPAGYAPVVIARRPIMAYYGPAPAPVNSVYYGSIPAFSPYAAVAPAAPVALPAGYAPVAIARRPIKAYSGPAPAPVNLVYYGSIPAYSPYAAVAPAPPVPVVTNYAPSIYSPAAVVAPAVPVTTYSVARPVVVGRSVYGTREVYVPGQPVLNTLRAVTP